MRMPTWSAYPAIKRTEELESYALMTRSELRLALPAVRQLAGAPGHRDLRR